MANNLRTEIKIDVELDENRVPESIIWSAPDGGIKNEEAKAILLSLWNPKEQEAARIDLWTKEMPVDEMKVFFHQVLVGMTHTFRRATGDDKMGDTMQDFTDYFAEKLDIKKK